MHQSSKHRGPDSSGFALYGPPDDMLVMRIKLADPGEIRDYGWADRLERNRNGIQARLAKRGAPVDTARGDQGEGVPARVRYSGELKARGAYVGGRPGREGV